MERRKMIYWGVGIVVLAVVLIIGFSGNDVESPIGEVQTPEDTASASIAAPASVPAPSTPKEINFGTYNIDYMNDNVKALLIKQMGASGKTAFYLPASEYVNVSRGAKHGVAFVIQNVNPNVPDGNEFSYNFNVDPSSVDDCGVSVEVAQSWIERGWSSSGMISGQWREDWNEWYDAMTVYFAFPANVEPCNIKYNFVIKKDKVAYDSRVLEFNLI